MTLLVLLTVLIYLCNSQPRINVREVSLPDTNGVSFVQVFYLESPLFFEDLGDKARLINAYHAGLAFRYYPSDPSIDFVLEFSAMDVMGSIFPTLPQDGLGPPHFRNEAHVWYRPFVNETYWLKASYVATIQIDDLKKVFQWAKRYVKKYQLWDIRVDGDDDDIIFAPSQTCVDFVWGVLQYMKYLNVAMDFMIPLKRDYISVHASQTPKLQYWDYMTAVEQDVVTAFYTAMNPETFFSIMQDLKAHNFTKVLIELAFLAKETHGVFFVPAVSNSINNTFWKIPVSEKEVFVSLDYTDGGLASPRKQWDNNEPSHSCKEDDYYVAFMISSGCAVILFGVVVLYWCQAKDSSDVNDGYTGMRQHQIN